jgi:hypothetical protein
MSTNERMRDWNSSWALFDGVIVCVTCKKTRPLNEANEEFHHEKGCRLMGKVDSCPWVALHDILDIERG